MIPLPSASPLRMASMASATSVSVGMTVRMAEQRLQRRLTAILAADVVGYSRLMERDEAARSSA